MLTHWPMGDLNGILDNFQVNLIEGWGVSCESALWWMPLDLIDDKSTLVQVMAWCHQATSHYLNQCWCRYVAIRPQWVNCEMVSQQGYNRHDMCKLCQQSEAVCVFHEKTPVCVKGFHCIHSLGSKYNWRCSVFLLVFSVCVLCHQVNIRPCINQLFDSVDLDVLRQSSRDDLRERRVATESEVVQCGPMLQQ